MRKIFSQIKIKKFSGTNKSMGNSWQNNFFIKVNRNKKVFQTRVMAQKKSANCKMMVKPPLT